MTDRMTEECNHMERLNRGEFHCPCECEAAIEYERKRAEGLVEALSIVMAGYEAEAGSDFDWDGWHTKATKALSQYRDTKHRPLSKEETEYGASLEGVAEKALRDTKGGERK